MRRRRPTDDISANAQRVICQTNEPFSTASFILRKRRQTWMRIERNVNRLQSPITADIDTHLRQAFRQRKVKEHVSSANQPNGALIAGQKVVGHVIVIMVPVVVRLMVLVPLPQSEVHQLTHWTLSRGPLEIVEGRVVL